MKNIVKICFIYIAAAAAAIAAAANCRRRRRQGPPPPPVAAAAKCRRRQGQPPYFDNIFHNVPYYCKKGLIRTALLAVKNTLNVFSA